MPDSIDRKQWLTEFFEFYGSIGFMQTYADSPVATLVGAVDNLDTELLPGLTAIIDDIDDPGDLFEPYDTPTFDMSPADNLVIDLRLLALLESKRVWWRWRDLSGVGNYMSRFRSGLAPMSCVREYARHQRHHQLGCEDGKPKKCWRSRSEATPKD